jgi:hypothetical protein
MPMHQERYDEEEEDPPEEPPEEVPCPLSKDTASSPPEIREEEETAEYRI